MLVANSFDLWKKDAFFSAAEEVQQSADIMESAYRRWISARREGMTPQHLDEITRQLQMALSTAKWQLEEFERAVQMSYRSYGDDVTIHRHRQFVSAIEEQISDVETTFKKSFDADGKKPFRWVHLDEQECDDLALFLSGTSGTSQQTTDHSMVHGTESTGPHDHNMNTKDNSEVSSKIKITKTAEDVSTRNDDANYFKEPEGGIVVEMQTEINYECDRNISNQRARSSLDTFALEIVVDQDDRQKNAWIGPTPKEKGYKPFFWSLRCEERAKGKGISNYTQLKIIKMINQCLRSPKNHRPHTQQVSSVLPVSSMRYILAMMLTIFLVVPFLFYSS